jgi:hypothetical protein
MTGSTATLVSLRSLLMCVAFSSSFTSPSPACRTSSEAAPSTLQQRTSQAFARYVLQTDSRNEAELRDTKNLLWIDALSDQERKAAYAALQQGQVRLEQRHTLEAGQEIACPAGLIHHWEGVVFIPGVHLDDALGILQDYDHHSQYYSPDVERSKLESRDGDHFRAFLRFRRKKVITVVLNTVHEVHYFRDSPTEAHSRSSATRIAEVEDAGKSGEREKSHDDDGGYLWGMDTWWRLIERDGGVYVQSEVVSLTRDIPTGLGWMIGAFVSSIPKETLTFTLQATRKAVLGHAKSTNAD